MAPGGADKTNDGCTCQDAGSRDMWVKNILSSYLTFVVFQFPATVSSTIPSFGSEVREAQGHPKIDQVFFNLRSKLMGWHREILLRKSQISVGRNLNEISRNFHPNLKLLYVTGENTTEKRQWTRVNKTSNTKRGQKKQYGSVRAQLVVLVYSKVVTILQMQQYGSVKASLVVLVTCLFQSGNNTTDEVY